MQTDWARIAWLMQASRALDAIEEGQLLPERKILYQFCARGHELGQSLLGLLLTDPHDGIGAYYRSRPLMLALGLQILQEAAAGPLARAASASGGRDIGVVFNMPSRGGATVLPGCGGVGSAVHAGRRLGPGHLLPSRRPRRRLVRGALPSFTAEMRRRRPTASGRRSRSRRLCACRCCSTLKTTASAFPCLPACRPRAAISPLICSRSLIL
jgi:hypothetical protein